MLFYWHSEALKQYGRGYIVAAAQTVEEAREIVTRDFETFAREQWCWLFLDSEIEDESWVERRAAFLRDIAVPPKTSRCLFIMGSE